MIKLIKKYESIDTTLGLKYLNGNETLYLSILDNFLNRYEKLEVLLLLDDELEDLMHSIKGIAATLGMVPLTQVAHQLHSEPSSEAYRIAFTIQLKEVIDELKTLRLKSKENDCSYTLLVVDNHIDTIDSVIELLGEENDILVALDIESANDILIEEEVDLILCDFTLAKEMI